MSLDHKKWLKSRISGKGAMLVPGVMNALAARIADDLGYEALYVTGAGLSNAYLGLPDVAFLTLSQIADHVAMIRNITDKPLIVDGDTGFGNAVNVWHTIRTFERAGASAVQIEDQHFPKRCGHFDGKGVISYNEMVQKVRAAVDARTDQDLQIIARTDAYATDGLSAAIDRANAYLEAGADMVFVEAPKDRGDIEAIIQQVQAPHVVNRVIGGKTTPISFDELNEMGAAVVLYANAALQGAILGMQHALGQLKKDGVLTEAEGLVATFQERQRLVAMKVVEALERTYASD